MSKSFSIVTAGLIAGAIVGTPLAFADVGHNGSRETDRETDHIPATGGQGDMSAHDAHHRHDAWVTPPTGYVGKTWSGWSDKQAAARGRVTYQQRCSYCHGDDGKGTGPMADRLAHRPADLTNNFHTAPGKGDDYLFWRITEGGSVEPFRSQQSAMPRFGGVLDEAARWDVLAYVHQQFHGGFPEQVDMPHDHDGHHHDSAAVGDAHGH